MEFYEKNIGFIFTLPTICKISTKLGFTQINSTLSLSQFIAVFKMLMIIFSEHFQ